MTKPAATAEHIPVLLNETIAAFGAPGAGVLIDGTLGLGGHAAALLDAVPQWRLLGIDADPDALEIAAARLRRFGNRVTLIQGNYRDLAKASAGYGLAPVTGVLLDLGVSSLQFSGTGRGFTIQWDQPLDMRMNPALSESAADLVNQRDEGELARIFRDFGEEPRAKAVARSIIRARPITTTAQLAVVVERALGGRHGRIHPATRVFQALRIAVNAELEALAVGLAAARDVLAPSGRLVVISYHSLEDRLVKTFLVEQCRSCVCPPRLPVCVCNTRPSFRLVTKGAVSATSDEVSANPRARSARLRAAERT